MLFRKITVFLSILAGSFCCNTANAQLWSYIGWTPAKEKIFEKRLKKEAYKVITHYNSDKVPYDEMIYRISSLDSSIYYVHVMYTPFTGFYTIKCATDSLKIEDCKGVARLHILRKNLFEIVYCPRGGSDDGFENVLLLAIKNGKFCIVMDVQSMHNYDGPGFYGLNETHLILTGKSVQNYRLTLKNMDMREYDKKSKSFTRYHTYKLKYSNLLNVFYTSHEQINGYVYDENWNKKKQINGEFPVIDLGDYKYCYADDHWYAVGKDFDKKETTLYSYCYRPMQKN